METGAGLGQGRHREKTERGGLSVFVARDSCYEPHKKEQMTGLITI